MADYPFISVIIPVYQVEDYIDDCLKCIAAQNYPGAVEYIFIDDCCTDRSIMKIECFMGDNGGRIDYKILRHERNRGLSAARNTGIEAARGEYLLFLDSDDSLSEDALNSLSQPLLKNRYDMVVGRYQERGDSHKLGPSLPDGTVLHGKEIFEAYDRAQITISVWNKLIKKSFVLENQLFFYEGIIHEDSLWSFIAYNQANDLYVVDRVTYYYSIRNGSIITSSAIQKRIDSLGIVLQEMFSYIESHRPRTKLLCYMRVERVRMGLLGMLRSNWKSFKNEYLYLRKIAPSPWYACFIHDGWHIKDQIRDLHLASPAGLGASLYFAWFKMESLLFKR